IPFLLLGCQNAVALILTLEHSYPVEWPLDNLPLVRQTEHAAKNLKFAIDARYLKLLGVSSRNVSRNQLAGDLIDSLTSQLLKSSEPDGGAIPERNLALAANGLGHWYAPR